MSRVTSPFSVLLSGLLILAMATGVFAHGYAQVRSADPDRAIQVVVICGGSGTLTILLDQDGNPIDPTACLQELCAACLPGPFLTTDVAVRASLPADVGHAIAFAATIFPVSDPRHRSDPRPRGPPLTP